MSQPPEAGGRLALAERMLRIITGLTIQNALTLGLLVLVAVPAYVAWQFLHDPRLRQEFLSSARVVEGLGVPCLVFASSLVGQAERYSVLVAYDTDGRLERDIAVRSPGVMSADEIAKACDIVRADAEIMRQQIGTPSERK
jgi:hypothetical protein